MELHLDETPAPMLPARPRDGHKGTFGTVAVVGGSVSGGGMMLGAPALAGRGALRSGCGLCKVVTPEPLLGQVLAMLPSATGVALAVDDAGELVSHEASAVLDEVLANVGSVVIGPGMGKGAGVEAAVLRVVQQRSVPVVVDADGLNAMASIPEVWRDFHAPAVLTPHPGEFRRLAEAMKITLDPVSKATRPSAAASLAQRLGCVVVLKGEGTIVSDGVRTWRCERGHPCMATGGTGDVLAGVIGGLLAQYYDATRMLAAAKLASRSPELAAKLPPAMTPYDLARAAVEAHGRAGELWASENGQAGMMAGELADLVVRTIQRGDEPAR